MSAPMTPNRLIREKSPYLLQHAYNPVDWYPWGEEAFEKAAKENKPVFLSIGYSTCHWCHVMERESFEDPEVAAVLNEHYVPVKVDREERPDIDHLYMAVCQAMTGQGGWPLTVLLTPDRKPFFAGTYFPKHRRHGRYGLMDLLPAFAEAWKQNPERLREVADEILAETKARALSSLDGSAGLENLSEDAFAAFLRLFDEEYGGFGGAPKFPTPHNLIFLLRFWHRTKESEALRMVERTLDAMYAGGLFDHIGFGFARYSTDRMWLVPHFEKMLYDNALLAYAYAEAYQATGHRRHREVAERVVEYVLRDMRDEGGGFYSAEDADSEGEEGKFYLWTPDEVRSVLGEEESRLFSEVYHITPEGNFEGRSIPNLIGTDWAATAARFGMPPAELTARLEDARRRLFEARRRRVPPLKDDKILTGWNGLMIAALAKASFAFDRSDCYEAAEAAARFVLDRLRRPDGRLLARYRDGEAAIPAFLDDYAFVLWGLVELYEAEGDGRWLVTAKELADDMIRLFRDERDGGFFFTGNDAERLPERLKETFDGATPSGNATAAWVLGRLGRLADRTDWSELAESLPDRFSGAIRRFPTGHAMWLTALEFMRADPVEIAVAGDPRLPETEALRDAVREVYLPHALRIWKAHEKFPFSSGTSPDRPTAFVCRRSACETQTTDANALRQALHSLQG